MVYEGKYYGTLKSELKSVSGSLNKIPVLDIDVKGAIHIQQQYPENTLSLFIEPPSVDELKKRLESRGTETAESLAARINKAAYELSFKDQFNKLIINDDFHRACSEAEDIVADFIKYNKIRFKNSFLFLYYGLDSPYCHYCLTFAHRFFCRYRNCFYICQ